MSAKVRYSASLCAHCLVIDTYTFSWAHAVPPVLTRQVIATVTGSMKMCSAEHVSSICVQADRGEAEGICRGWAGLSVAMFSGFPGYPQELQLADSELLAVS